MENIRKKLSEINVDILSVKPIRVKEQVFLSDDIEINLILKENNELKQLNQDCKAEILYSVTSDGITTSVEQKDNILIDTLLSKITIHPNKNALRLGMNKIQIKVCDPDEQFYLFPILLNVQATVDSDLIVDNFNEIQVLKDLENKLVTIDGAIVKVNTNIDNIETRITSAENTIIDKVADMESIINLEINETRDKLDYESSKIDQAIEEMDNKLNNKNQEIDKFFLKSIQLEPFLNENNRVCFTSDFINIPAKELIKYSFMVHVNTSPYTQQINTVCIGILTFSLESNGVVVNFNSLFSKTIQGNSTKVSLQFNNNSNVITNIEDFGYKILVITNGIKDSLSQSRCVFTPIASGLL